MKVTYAQPTEVLVSQNTQLGILYELRTTNVIKRE